MNSNSFRTRANDRHFPEPFDYVVRQRRATRHFTSEPVPEEDLTTILQDAALAPSGYNLQPWRFLVIQDLDNRARLRQAAFDQSKITEAPVVVIAYAPHAGWKEKLDAVFSERVRRGALDAKDLERTKREALAFVGSLPLAVWLNRHVMIAVTHLMLAAEVHGWSTAPMEGFDAGKIRQAFNFPEQTEIIALLAIGRAKEPLASFPGRLSLPELVCSENLETPWPKSAGPW